ncbi:MAG: ATP-dependent Clp protease ATP-binding subunit ClpA [Acidobacteriota bacterium]|nr:ATP-dependent Clp protease ATP-binding subunit ClpA [Acidobacteriota bacterium]
MITKELQATLTIAVNESIRRRHEYVTLEHLLFALLYDRTASNVIRQCGGNIEVISRELSKFFTEHMEQLDEDQVDEVPEQTDMFQRVLQYALLQAEGSGQKEINGGNILAALFHAERSHAIYLLKKQGITRLDVLNYIAHGISKVPGDETMTDARGSLDAEPDGDATQTARDPLQAYTVNLNERARDGQIDPLIGRTPEVERTVQVLCRRRKNNPIYVGEPGVGKTAIAEGLALKIHLGEVPEVLGKAQVYALDMGAVLAGTKYRGEFEQRFKAIIAALQKLPDAILFIDEIHTIVGAGAVSGGSMDASNIIKPALASGRLRCIGSTTYAEYKSAFERDRALARRFQKIEVGEPSVAETIEILNGLKGYYEEHHGIVYTVEALKLAAELAAKYMHDRFLPDKAIDVMDEAGAALKLLPKETRPASVGIEEVERVVARMAKIPPKTVASSEKDRLRKLDGELRAVIFGQDQAISQVVRAIKLARSGLGHPEKPVGSFLFSGPTGVGKTELAKQLAVSLGVEFIRFDMSEYAEAHTVSRLIGAPPGYVGFDQGGLLTDAITRTPYAVLVLDEIEKAHPNLFNILLQVMDHATLTDNNGKKADFRNVILIMTTNAGAQALSEGGIGFQSSTGKGKGRGAIERTFSPEFRNRLDAWIAFESLSLEIIERVVGKFIGELNAQLTERQVTVRLTPGAEKWLARNGFDRLYGARPMSRLIQTKIKEPLAEVLLFGETITGGEVLVDEQDGGLVLVYPDHVNDELTSQIALA